MKSGGVPTTGTRTRSRAAMLVALAVIDIELDQRLGCRRQSATGIQRAALWFPRRGHDQRVGGGTDPESGVRPGSRKPSAPNPRLEPERPLPERGRSGIDRST